MDEKILKLFISQNSGEDIFPKEILKKLDLEGNIGQEQLWFLIEIKISTVFI